MKDVELRKKHMKIIDLLFEVNDPMVLRFFDSDSDKMLDDKIEVLTSLKNGTPPDKIPKYYEVLELMPSDNKILWD